MRITTDDFDVTAINDDDEYILVTPKDKTVFLDTLELVGTNPHQSFPPDEKDDGYLLKPETLAMWLTFEILNYGV